MSIPASVAAVTVSIIISASALFGMGAFTQSNDYATIYFDGGYQKIGVIKEQRAFTKATVFYNGEKIHSGSFSNVIAGIKRDAKDKENETAWKDGVTLQATTGVNWEGSQSNFELTVENFTLTSTEQSRIKVVDVIKRLEDEEKKIKAEHQIHAAQALRFGPSPKSSLGILDMIGRLAKS